MNPKLLREVRIFTPAVEIGPPSNDPEPRVLLCEYDTNESPCRYDPVCGLSVSPLVSSLTARTSWQATGMLLVDQPSGHSCAQSASVSPECGPIVPKPSLRSQYSSLLGGLNEPEAISSSPLAPSSSKENEQGRYSRDPAFAFVRKDTSEAIPNPIKTDSQRHLFAPDAALHHADLEDDRENGLLNLDPKTPPPPSLNAPSTSPSPFDYDLDLHDTYDEEKDDNVAPIFETAPTVSTIPSHDHDLDHSIGLLDLEFDDYSDAFKLSQKVVPLPGPARWPRGQWTDPVDEKVAYIMSMTVGE